MQKIKTILATMAVSLYATATIVFGMPMMFNSETFTKEVDGEPSEQVVATPKNEFETVDEIIKEVAPLFKQDPKLISKITFCESSHRVQSHDGGRAFNITGIHDTTFNYWLKQYEKEMNETLDLHSTYDQIKITSWAFSKGDKYRNQWTSYVAYINGGEYTFYSKMLGKTFTARCK